MKLLVIGYVLISFGLMVLGIVHRNDTTEDDEFKFNWRFLIGFLMVPFIPLLVKLWEI